MRISLSGICPRCLARRTSVNPALPRPRLGLVLRRPTPWTRQYPLAIPRQPSQAMQPCSKGCLIIWTCWTKAWAPWTSERSLAQSTCLVLFTSGREIQLKTCLPCISSRWAELMSLRHPLWATNWPFFAAVTQVVKCTKVAIHDWKTCPYSHGKFLACASLELSHFQLDWRYRTFRCGPCGTNPDAFFLCEQRGRQLHAGIRIVTPPKPVSLTGKRNFAREVRSAPGALCLPH